MKRRFTVKASAAAKSRHKVTASSVMASAKMYVEDNAGGRDILLTDGTRWWYPELAPTGYFGDVDIYGPSNIDGTARELRLAIRNGERWTPEDMVDEVVGGLSGWTEIDEYRGMTIEDIDSQVNYNDDGTPKGHDETIWVEV